MQISKVFKHHNYQICHLVWDSTRLHWKQSKSYFQGSLNITSLKNSPHYLIELIGKRLKYESCLLNVMKLCKSSEKNDDELMYQFIIMRDERSLSCWVDIYFSELIFSTYSRNINYFYLYYLRSNYCCYHNVLFVMPSGLHQVYIALGNLQGILSWIHYLIFICSTVHV